MAAGMDAQTLSHAHTLATAKAGEVAGAEADAGACWPRCPIDSVPAEDRPHETPSASSPSLAAAMLLAGCATRPAAPVSVKVLAINDFHGNLLPPAAASASRTRPTRRKTVTCRPAAPSTWPPRCSSCGEEPQPRLRRRRRPDRRHAAAVGAVQGRADDRVAGLMGLEASAVGNHEFDKGAAELLRLQRGGCTRATAARARSRCRRQLPVPGGQHGRHKTGQTLLPAYHVKRFQGIPVAFIGLTLKDTPTIVVPAGVAGPRLPRRGRDGQRAGARAAAPGHRGHRAADPRRRRAHRRLQRMPGHQRPHRRHRGQARPAVDLVISGHTHRAYNCRIDGRLVTSGDKYGTVVGEIDLVLDPPAATSPAPAPTTRSCAPPASPRTRGRRR
jgi:5'-nucleotidase